MLPRRPLPRLLLLLAASFALLLALVAVVWFDNEANRGVVATPPTAPIPHGDGPELGVNLFNLHVEPDRNVITRTLQLASEMGARYARMQIPWDDIEIHGRGDFSDRRNDLNGDGTPDSISAWEKYDLIVETANRFDIQLIMRLERAPLWARPELANTPAWRDGLAIDGNSTGPPDDFADYGNFVRTIVSRYRGQVRYFQIWNEPNLKNEWNWQTPGPQDFVRLLQVGYSAAREANPEAVVLFPSLAATDGLDYRAPMSELEYLDQVYQAGGAAYFDVMSAQAYGLGQPPEENRYVFVRGRGNWAWNRPLDTRIDVSRMVLLREVMERNGDAATPVWVGEFGWNAAPDSIPPERRFTWGEPVSEAQKGEYIVGMVERARREWPWVGVMNVWMLRYGGYREPAPDDPTQYFALLGRDWQLLPSYERLRTWSQQPAVAGVGAHAWQHPAVEPIPDGWRICFTGTKLTLVGGLAGGLQPTLDGQPTALARDGLNSMQALSTDSLADGPHTLEVVAPGAEAPAYFLVERARPWGWFWALLPALLLAALAISTVATMRQAFSVADSVFSGDNLITRNQGLVVGLAMGLSLLLFYRATPTVPLTVLGLLLFGGLALLRPDVGLLFVPLTWPLYFMPKGIWDAAFGIGGEGMRFPMHELVLLLVLAATVARWLWQKLQTQNTKNAAMQRRSDTAGLQDTQSAVRSPQYSIAHRSSFIVPVALFLLAGTIGLLVVPAEGRGAALREWRWLIVEPLIFVGLVWWLSRPETGDGRPETERPETGDRRPETSPEQLLKSLLQTPSNVASSQLVTRNSARPEPVEGSLVTRILAFWLAGGAFVGLVGVLQFLGLNLAPLIGDKVGFSDDQIITQGVQRVTSVYGHPNNLGLYLGRVWPVAAALLIYELRVTSYDLKLRGLRGGTKQLLSTRMLLLTMCALLSIGGLLFSFSRGALLGALAAGAVLLVLHPSLNLARRFGFGARRGWLLLAIGGGALGLAVLLGLAAAALGIERLNPLGESGNIRLLTWQSALAMLRDHPFTGIGLDQFARLYPQYIDPSLAGTNEINTAHPHNLLLDIPLRMGPLGLLAFGWLLVLFFRQVQRADRGSQQTGDGRPGTGDRSSVAPQDVAALRRAALLAGLAAAMTAALVHGMVDSFYFWPDLAFTFWLLLLLAVWGGED